jgi:hypothetical protein
VASRIAVFVAVCALASLFAPPSLARTNVIAQKSTKVPLGTVYLRSGLLSGHWYRIEVTSSGHQPFAGYGTEYIIGVAKGSLFTGSPSLNLNGTTPRFFAVTQPVKGRLNEWLLAVQIELKKGHNLTVRIRDMGKH